MGRASTLEAIRSAESYANLKVEVAWRANAVIGRRRGFRPVMTQRWIPLLECRRERPVRRLSHRDPGTHLGWGIAQQFESQLDAVHRLDVAPLLPRGTRPITSYRGNGQSSFSDQASISLMP
jgi:hypothetical protein